MYNSFKVLPYVNDIVTYINVFENKFYSIIHLSEGWNYYVFPRCNMSSVKLIVLSYASTHSSSQADHSICFIEQQRRLRKYDDINQFISYNSTFIIKVDSLRESG